MMTIILYKHDFIFLIMSYSEKKALKEITEHFTTLSQLTIETRELLEFKSLKKVDEIALSCAKLNKQVNIILKQWYPEIKEMKDKLDIKSQLKFYYELIDKLSDFVRNVENFQKIDDGYYENLIEFILDKNELINGKYREICSSELIAFYDKKSREQLEAILEQKAQNLEREYFMMGPLEEEIRKNTRIFGADLVSICPADSLKGNAKLDPTIILKDAQTVVSFAVAFKITKLIEISDGDASKKESLQKKNLDKIEKITNDLMEYLRSKKYQVANYTKVDEFTECPNKNTRKFMDELSLLHKFLKDGTPIDDSYQFFVGSVITNANLLSD